MGENIPKISVIMPVYKGDNYLSEAVDSILNQTFSDFEFIIICDDPTNKTRHVLDKYKQNDSRIRIYYQERQGLVNSLNKGISLAKGEYIARMDADDISLPARFERQVEFMDNNPEIGISGTWVRTVGDVPGAIWKHPCDHETIKSRMLFETVIAHPSIIARKELFSKNGFAYMQDEVYAEDYGLWVRAAKVVKLANLPKILIHYRIHKSTSDRKEQKLVANNIRLAQIRELGINPTKKEFEVHEALSYYEIDHNKKFVLQVRFWLEKLETTNLEMKIYPEPAFSAVLGHYWYHACKASTYLGLNAWNLFNESKLSNSISLSPVQKIKFILRSIV
ncbi:glycosyltransferase [Methanosarcina sp. Z-7115]|uniref:Glycosyltransferase n=1 Tax=Methanosarcina baikalica TaxID=3073890 RepID=A0ABU2D323_9EURY|nr:glycosyltransferase [Methanosarcina sp. Z-7115]MDR7666382.1 glycosyltransferase [Methanosarcina sp. Z-7115]